MTDTRYTELMRDLEGKEVASLTPEEIQAGWHFCWEWDGLLVGPGMKELEVCTCTKHHEQLKPMTCDIDDIERRRRQGYGGIDA